MQRHFGNVDANEPIAFREARHEIACFTSYFQNGISRIYVCNGTDLSHSHSLHHPGQTCVRCWMLGIHLIVPFEKASLHIYSLVNGWIYWRTARGSSAQSVWVADLNDSSNDAAKQDRAEKADAVHKSVTFSVAFWFSCCVDVWGCGGMDVWEE